MGERLDPKPVRYRDGEQRTALLRLPVAFPKLYVFDPRPGYSQDRGDYVSYETTVLLTRIIGADDVTAYCPECGELAYVRVID